MTTREYAEAIMVWRDPDVADVEDVIKAAVAEEREACAKIASGFAGNWKERGERENSPGLQLSLLARVEACKTIAEYIRARSNPAE